MVATHILQRPAQFQWESTNCRSSNCRPTCAAMIAGFYKDRIFTPDTMRRLMGYSKCGPTNAPSSVQGLKAAGVPSTWGQLYPAELKAKLRQNIPVDIAVLYGKIPRDRRYIQDMGFYGSHSVVACKILYKNGVPGLAIRDPDRWGTGEVDYVWWPDSIWIPAHAALQYVSVWPLSTKVIPVTPPASDPYADGIFEGDDNVKIVLKAEDWYPTRNAITGASNGVFRSVPKRSAPVVERVPLNTKIRSVTEVYLTNTSVDNNWRTTRRGGKTLYMLRSDWNPAVYGGDPATDAKLDNLITGA